MLLSKIFATIALLYGTFLSVATFAWRDPVFQLLHSQYAVGITFLTAAIVFVPFVITYTQFGLNSAEGEAPSFDTVRRRTELAKECPSWNLIWRGLIGFVMLSWLGFAIIGDRIHPFFAFSGAISLVSGAWFALVYPVAKKLFNGPKNC